MCVHLSEKSVERMRRQKKSTVTLWRAFEILKYGPKVLYSYYNTYPTCSWGEIYAEDCCYGINTFNNFASVKKWAEKYGIDYGKGCIIVKVTAQIKDMVKCGCWEGKTNIESSTWRRIFISKEEWDRAFSRNPRTSTTIVVKGHSR